MPEFVTCWQAKPSGGYILKHRQTSAEVRLVAILNRIRQLRIESDNVSQAHPAKQIDVSRQTLVAIEGGQRLPSLEIAHRVAAALDCGLDDVFHYESEFPADDDDDGRMTIIVCIDDDPEWWKSGNVSRVTIRAKRCSDAARKPHNAAVWAHRTGSARRVIRSTGRIGTSNSIWRNAVPRCQHMRRSGNRISGRFATQCGKSGAGNVPPFPLVRLGNRR